MVCLWLTSSEILSVFQFKIQEWSLLLLLQTAMTKSSEIHNYMKKHQKLSHSETNCKVPSNLLKLAKVDLAPVVLTSNLTTRIWRNASTYFPVFILIISSSGKGLQYEKLLKVGVVMTDTWLLKKCTNQLQASGQEMIRVIWCDWFWTETGPDSNPFPPHRNYFPASLLNNANSTQFVCYWRC